MKRVRGNRAQVEVAAVGMAATVDAMAGSAAGVNRFPSSAELPSRALALGLSLFDHGCAQVVARTKEEGVLFMADDQNTQENINVPPIPKETAGAVAGAALGSMIGPAGAVVGGVVGAIAGKAAAEGRLKPAAKKAAAR